MKSLKGLLQLFMLTIVVTVLAYAQDTKVSSQKVENDSASLKRKGINKADLHPVTLTTLLEKKNTADTLRQWFDLYSEDAEVGAPEQTFVNGYEALTFLAAENGVLQRGLAVDLGDGRILFHLTTDRKADAQAMFDSASPFIKEPSEVALATAAAEPIACNCVRWARTQVPSIPQIDLTNFSNKLKIINHRFARPGSVAVIYVPSSPKISHVAVVRDVGVNPDGSLKVFLREANWKGCQITERSGTPDALNIRGYFDPAYAYPSSYPGLDSLSSTSLPAGRQTLITARGIGFDASSVQAIILGGWCDTFAKCVIPNNVMMNRSSTSLDIPVMMNNPGKYTIYMYNSQSGKSSNGKTITIN